MTNGEKYKTAQERECAFCELCEKRYSCDGCELESIHNRSATGRPACAFAWLDLEAEDEKPLPCPFCGGETSSKNCVGGWCVQCDCGYMSKQFDEGDDDEVLKAKAIAAHNRVAKAAAESEAKE